MKPTTEMPPRARVISKPWKCKDPFPSIASQVLCPKSPLPVVCGKTSQSQPSMLKASGILQEIMRHQRADVAAEQGVDACH